VLALTWQQSTSLVNETTGFFKNFAGAPFPIGIYSNTNSKYITVGSLVKFVAPTGYFFDANNRLVAGVPIRADEKLTIWASPTAVVLDGTNQGLGNLPDGLGPVVLNNFVPTGAIPTQVIPVFITELTTVLIQDITEQIRLNRNFGLGYNNLVGTWYLITSTNLDAGASFSLANAQSQTGTNSDASWVIQAITDGSTYTVTSRSLDYYFGSVLETRFFFFGDQKIYDSRTGTVISDFVNVLKTNSRPDSNQPLDGDTFLRIIGQPIESDGFVDDFQVLVSYSDSDSDGVADNPDFFNDIVAPTVNPNSKLVFLQKTVDFDNLERYLLVRKGVVNSDYATADDIALVKDQFVIGQVFYAFQQEQFFVLSLVNEVRTVTSVPESDYIARTGRQDLYFQYRHNSPLTSRIDPGSTNIIDLYVVTNEYYTAYQNYLKDSTDTVPQPATPTIDQLSTTYSGLQNFKMISDNVIINSVEFLPLFGPRAPEALRATIKVIPAAGTTASISEIKNLVVTAMDEYFQLDKWDFGDTFYFSELAGYIHREIGDIVSSVVLVPLNTQKSFGDLYEIRSAPFQIFVNGATVNDVEVILALTSTNIRTAPGSGVI